MITASEECKKLRGHGMGWIINVDGDISKNPGIEREIISLINLQYYMNDTLSFLLLFGILILFASVVSL